MSEDNNTKAMQTVLRLFGERRDEIEDPARRDWKWRDGTILFPEGRCCYCGEPVRSNRLWVVDQGWLRGQLDIEKGVFEKPEHPHAGTDGGLCLGDSDSPTDALFFGINPNDTLRRDMNIGRWYTKMFEHTCGKEGGLKRSELFKAEPYHDNEEDEDDYCEDCCRCCEVECCSQEGTCDCGCEDCFCVTTACFDCHGPIGDDYRQISEDMRWRWHCHACWTARYLECNRCERLILIAEAVDVEGHSDKYCRYCKQYLLNLSRMVQPTWPVTASAMLAQTNRSMEEVLADITNEMATDNTVIVPETTVAAASEDDVQF